MEQLSTLFSDAATLMFTGMSFVFIFLSLLILVINYVIRPLALKYPDPVAKVSKPKHITKNAVASDSQISPAIVAAISSAVNSYRHKNNRS